MRQECYNHTMNVYAIEMTFSDVSWISIDETLCRGTNPHDSLQQTAAPHVFVRVVVVANTSGRTLFDAAGSSRLGYRHRARNRMRPFALSLLRHQLAIV
jgi:hypothetical protein